MTIQRLQLEIIQAVASLDDIQPLGKIKNILVGVEKDWWNELSDEEKAANEEGISQAERGQTIPLSEVMKRFGKWD